MTCAVAPCREHRRRGSCRREGRDADERTAHALEQAGFGFGFVAASRERSEGMDAFLEKRDPKFEGR
jgi:enoyl-CoA hydratase/carnithine racemase